MIFNPIIRREGGFDLGAGLGDRRDALQTGIVDQHVDAVERSQRLLDRRAVADVAAQRLDVASVLGGELGGGRLHARIVGQDGEVGAGRREGFGDAPADAPARAGHQDLLSIEVETRPHRVLSELFADRRGDVAAILLDHRFALGSAGSLGRGQRA
jgi:hypothetical protein